ncbi:MAG: fimbrillin family protein [Muribaculaceae bacterium]|nr:fimbrillin family protein [Muribaculaceae bacterium]
MKIYNFMLLTGAAAAMMTACSSEDTPLSDNNNNEIAFLCQYEDGTRVTDTKFESQDQIGVYMTAKDAALQIGGNELNNELFSYNGSAWTAARKVYWDNGSHDVYAYYPYAAKVNDTEDYTFELPTDQSTAKGFSSADFVWASAKGITASASPVALKFSHRMSKAIIKLEKSEDYDGEIPSDCKVSVLSTATTASIDLSSGGVSKDTYSSTNTIVAKKVSNTEYQAIVVPQNIESRRPLIEVETQGVSYLMEGKISFKQGYAHTLIVTLSKNPTQTKIEIGGSIGGWN